MRKEVLTAIIIGLALGLVITYGVYRSRQTNSFTNGRPALITNAPSSPQASSTPGTLVLHSPDDETVQSDTQVTVAGTTIPNAYVAVFINDDDTLTTADDQGNFSVVKNLNQGGNVIIVQSIDSQGQLTQVERTVVVDDGSSPSPVPSATPIATSSAKKK